MYDAETGRWMAADPMSEKHYSRSSYSYALNNPLRYIDPMGLDTLGFGTKMPENATPGQIYRGGDGRSWRYDGNSWSIYNDDSNWSGDINEVVVFGSKGRSSSTTMTTNAGNIAFQNLMDRHNYMLTLLIEGSNSRWAEMEAQRRLQDALRRAEVARDHRDAMVARERAQALKQGIQENARNGGWKTATTERKAGILDQLSNSMIPFDILATMAESLGYDTRFVRWTGLGSTVIGTGFSFYANQIRYDSGLIDKDRDELRNIGNVTSTGVGIVLGRLHPVAGFVGGTATSSLFDGIEAAADYLNDGAHQIKNQITHSIKIQYR